AALLGSHRGRQGCDCTCDQSGHDERESASHRSLLSHEWDVTAIKFERRPSRSVERRNNLARSFAGAVQQRFEECGVEVIRLDPDRCTKPDACRPFEASTIIDRESTTGWDTGVRPFAREIDADIAPDGVLLGASAELLPLHIDECHPDDDAGSDIRG